MSDELLGSRGSTCATHSHFHASCQAAPPALSRRNQLARDCWPGGEADVRQAALTSAPQGRDQRPGRHQRQKIRRPTSLG
jgi:hypothetical protein